MTQDTDIRATVGTIMGAGFGYAFGSGRTWAWYLALILFIGGLYYLEKIDDKGHNLDDDDF